MKMTVSIRLLATCMVAMLFLHKGFARNNAGAGATDSLPAVPFSMTVVLVQFEARSGNQGNQLTWSTILEANLSHYEIERSTSKQPFKKIGTLKAAGSGSVSVEYSFTDEQPDNGTNIYRLKMVDTRGGSKISEHKLVNGNMQNLESAGFRAYPNPARAGTAIQMSVPEPGAYHVRLVSLQGSVVHTAKLDNNHGGGLRLDIPQGLRNGMYLIDAVASDGNQHHQQKILIQ